MQIAPVCCVLIKPVVAHQAILLIFLLDPSQSGVNAESLSHEDYLNAKGETVTTTFKTAGTYGYYCEPHQGAGMAGKVIVQ